MSNSNPTNAKKASKLCVFLIACAVTFGTMLAVSSNNQNYVVFAEDAVVMSTAQSTSATKKPTITKQPVSTSANEGGVLKFSVAASGENLKYQWYYRKKDSTTWVKSTLKSSTSSTISVTAYAYRDGQAYRCKVSNQNGYVYSSSAVMSVVKKPSITKEPQNRSLALGETAVFSVSATGTNLTYQWQYRTKPDGTWYISTMPGAKTNAVSVPVTAKRDGYQYRCKVSSQAGSVFSKVVTLDVSTKPKIITQSESKTVMENDETVMFLSAEGSGLQYQWQYRRGPGSTWYKSIQPGNKTFALTVTGTKARNGFQFRCKVTNKSGSVYTEPVTLTVIDAPEYQDVTYYGYLFFEGKDYGVPLYAYDGGVPSETIVDRTNSACFMNYSPTPLIADHVNQGFDIIKTLKIGDRCTIDRCGEKLVYECILIDKNGSNSGTRLKLSDGRDVTGLGYGLIALYTCNSTWTSVTITVFKEV